MRFKKGEPRPANAGRKKGSRNKKSVLRVEPFLAMRGINPVDEIIKLMPQLDPEAAVKTWLELQKYIQPVVKEDKEIINQPQELPIETNDNVGDLLQLVKP